MALQTLNLAESMVAVRLAQQRKVLLSTQTNIFCHCAECCLCRAAG
jgi:hypothetical protein